MKLVHISDLHFGMHRQELIEPFLRHLAQIKPDIVIISGDLTQRATPEQFLLFNDFLQKLPGIILTVPGNHDIPLYPSQFFIRMFDAFRYYKKYVNAKLTVSFANEEVRILGVNSVNPYRIKKGRLSSDTMNLIESFFSKQFTGLNILFFHHNFDRFEGTHKPLENYEQLINYTKTSPINIICAGHSHYANINIIEKNSNGACVFLHAGSLLCTRSKDGLNSYSLVETNKLTCDVKLFAYEDKHFNLQSEQHYEREIIRDI